MKKLASILFAAAVVISIAACNSTDKELVGNMKNDLTTLQANTPKLDAITKTADELAGKVMNVTDDKLRHTQKYMDYVQASTGLKQKVDATMAEHLDMMEKLKQLQADYEAGKIKKEDFMAEYENIQSSIKGSEELYQKLNKYMSMAGEEFQQFVDGKSPNKEDYTVMAAPGTVPDASAGRGVSAGASTEAGSLKQSQDVQTGKPVEKGSTSPSLLEQSNKQRKGQ